MQANIERNWHDRAVSPEQAVELITDDQWLFLHGGCAVSLPLEAALAERAHGLRGLKVYQMHKEGAEVLAAPELADHVRIQSLFCGAGIRTAIAEGRADYVPVFLSDIPEYIRQGIFRIDVAIVQVSYPDAHGYCSLGTSVDIARQAVDTARIIIGEVNRQLPRTHGNSFIHINELDAFIVTDRPVIEHKPRPMTAEADAIGRHIADLVPDGATLQVGIGAIPDAVLCRLRNKNDLGVHTEMFSDGIVDLVRAGNINNRFKPVHQGVSITSFIVGTRKVFDFVDDNPRVQFYPVDYTNNTARIRRHERMIAINGALQVDLTGQVCADSIGPRVYSGIGGQMDFVRGAALAPGGKAILSLPSTAKDGTISRIVPVLDAGAGVVTSRGHVQYVATEFGVVDLRGRSLRERADALISIAHPAHRAELRAQAVERHIFIPPARQPVPA